MTSRTTNARIAAVATTFAAGVLAAFALRPSTSGTSSATLARPQAAEVRTQVIRRTVHIVRHERPPRPRNGAVNGAVRSAGAAVAVAGAPSAPRTRASGVSAVAAPTSASSTGTPVRTRTSGAAATGAPSRSGSAAPVRTRTSGSSGAGSTGAGSTGAGKAVRTRTSGGGDGGNGGGHDD